MGHATSYLFGVNFKVCHTNDSFSLLINIKIQKVVLAVNEN